MALYILYSNLVPRSLNKATCFVGLLLVGLPVIELWVKGLRVWESMCSTQNKHNTRSAWHSSNLGTQPCSQPIFMHTLTESSIVCDLIVS
jgi:hypothetical protein